MKTILLIDGNSIMNRAFYGITAPMTTDDGKHTNALYGFLAIMFKNMEEVKPDYMLVAFDSKTAANVRKQQYDGYKKSRHAMPEELTYQMTEIKEILDAMNIKHLELPDFEGDDILGTVAKKFASDEIQAYILSGDRDLFQLVQKNITVRLPKTKMGHTETEIYDLQKVQEEYELEPQTLIELKGLMGDSSDEIPGAPGVGPKTATTLLKKFGSIDGIYKALGEEEFAKDFKPKVRESLSQNHELVELSKKLGTIRTDATVTDDIEELKVVEWNKPAVIEQFRKYKFRKYMNKFNLSADSGVKMDGVAKSKLETQTSEKAQSARAARTDNEAKLANTTQITAGAVRVDSSEEKANDIDAVQQFVNNVEIGKFEDTMCDSNDPLIFYIDTSKDEDENKIIKKEIKGVAIYAEKNGEAKVIYIKEPNDEVLKKIFECNRPKVGHNLSEAYVMLKERDIKLSNINFDMDVAAYDINPTNVKHSIEEIAFQYLDIDLAQYKPAKQTSLFEANVEEDMRIFGAYIFAIKAFQKIAEEKMTQEGIIKLFNQIEIPLIEVLGEMQVNGMMCIEEVLQQFGEMLKTEIQKLTEEIYELAGEEFNINSTQQLGKILFEKLGLPTRKKTKTGYSTDVATLEKLANKHEIIPKILEYRTLAKLNSTYVEGLIPYINPKDNRIHSYFHQTITATGRISSTEPNLQNIPSREELGKNIKKAFIPQKGYVYIDADYSQIELRVLAHMSQDVNMMNAFKNDEDIHREVASKVFNMPLDQVTKEQRSRAKAVNFGIVYGITGFGLANQIRTSNKEAKEYIDSYLEKYSGVNAYMKAQVEKAQQTGYVETLFGRKRFIQELKSSNYMVREFGKRAAMNTPIQGTAADIMKIAMNKVYEELNKAKIDARIVLQVHDELILEASEKDKQQAKEILKTAMENAAKLDVPLKVELSEANSWYEAK